MRIVRTAWLILIATAIAATITGRTLLADDRSFLISKHSAADLKCAQCHQERPPELTPANEICLGCHGDQQALANKTREASPNPHASPHLPAGEAQICVECHHVHRKSEVSCSNCHREFYFDVK